MALTRREFFKKLATAAVLAPIAPKLIAEASESFVANATPVSTVASAPESGVLTYQMLEEAYQQICYGREEPDLIVMAPDVYVELRVLIDRLNKSLGHPTYVFYDEETEQICPVYNGAHVSYDKALPRGSWISVNSKSADPKLSGFFTKENPNWQPISENVFAEV